MHIENMLLLYSAVGIHWCCSELVSFCGLTGPPVSLFHTLQENGMKHVLRQAGSGGRGIPGIHLPITIIIQGVSRQHIPALPAVFQGIPRSDGLYSSCGLHACNISKGKPQGLSYIVLAVQSVQTPRYL